MSIFYLLTLHLFNIIIYELEISSMHSLLFDTNCKLFQSEENLKTTENILMKAIDFASEINCKNLVFGSPKNRMTASKEDYKKAIILFRKLGDYAFSKNTNFSLEANPKIYGTNFINTTDDAINFIKQVKSEGFKLNLDFGTVITNNENLHLISENIYLINHVHISEPFLEPILPRKEHRELYDILKANGYNFYVTAAYCPRYYCNIF